MTPSMSVDLIRETNLSHLPTSQSSANDTLLLFTQAALIGPALSTAQAHSLRTISRPGFHWSPAGQLQEECSQ